MDAFGHVNNVQYLRLLEEARVTMLFTEPKVDDIMTLDGQLVVVRHEIDYLAPLALPAGADRRSRPGRPRIGGASITVAYEVKDAEHLYARARTVLAAIDKDTGRARRLAPDERSWIQAYHEPEGRPGVTDASLRRLTREPGSPQSELAAQECGAIDLRRVVNSWSTSG